MFLTRPDIIYKESYLEGLREFQREGRNLQFNLGEAEQDFGSFVQMLLDREDVTKLKLGKVKETILWLIDNDEYIGRVSIRHELTEYLYKYAGHIGYEIAPVKRKMGYGKRILTMGLEQAKKFGLDRVLLTCNSDNIGSKKIIEANGGVFENEVQEDGESSPTRRYWIDIE